MNSPETSESENFVWHYLRLELGEPGKLPGPAQIRKAKPCHVSGKHADDRGIERIRVQCGANAQTEQEKKRRYSMVRSESIRKHAEPPPVSAVRTVAGLVIILPAL